MHRESLSIALACGLGALIGSLIGLESASYFGLQLKWWCAAAGMLAGGIIAYVAIDFRQVYMGVARAYRETLAWRPDLLLWESAGHTIVQLAIVMFTLILYATLCIIIVTPSEWVITLEYAARTTVGAISILVSIYLLIVLFFVESQDLEEREENLVRERVTTRKVWRYANPITAPYWIMWHIAKVMPRILGVMVFIATQIPAFTKRAFIYVHSQQRTICFVGATIGVGVGFACGNAAVGAVIGMMLGLISYRLVAVWWLKLKVCH